jgi:hypothetical protein
MIILNTLYADMRKYLLTNFELPVDDTTVIKGYNNLNPIPKDAIIMTFRSGRHLDQHSIKYEGDQQIIFNSVQGIMQLDFYGESSFDRAQQVSTLWNTIYTTDILQDCVPLSTPMVRDLSFVNEAGLYELRFMLDLELQYNTKYQKTVNIVSDASDITTELNNV